MVRDGERGEEGSEGFNHRVKHDENGLGWKNQSFVVIARWGREKKGLLPPNIPTTLRFICPNEPLLLNPSCYLMGEMGEMGEILHLNQSACDITLYSYIEKEKREIYGQLRYVSTYDFKL